VPVLEIHARDPGSRARAGILRTNHGPVRTPAFVPLATKATVKGLLPHEVAELGYDMVLGNTFHLFLDPGHERIAGFGGLHPFMGWDAPIITDSGGFQVFSMGHGTVADEIKGKVPHGPDRMGRILSIEEEGVSFRSYLDGSTRFMGPETSMEVQARLNSTSRSSSTSARRSTSRGVHPALDGAHPPLARPLPGLARRARPARPARLRDRPGRRPPRPAGRVAEHVAAAGTPGIAIGGSLGADKAQMYEVVDWTTAVLPEDRPRHLLGIGEIDDLVRGVELGIDTFDCAMPTRLGRHGVALVPSPTGAGGWTSPRAASRTTAGRSWRTARARPASSGCRAATCATSSTPAS
jgi:queuine tRNA-ribosyltransferase